VVEAMRTVLFGGLFFAFVAAAVWVLAGYVVSIVASLVVIGRYFFALLRRALLRS
jgi:hypothetical protein